MLAQRIAKRWLEIFLIAFGIFNLLPFAAPVMMQAGWDTGGKIVYTMYSPLCHQMAQRSFFLFGEQIMYNSDELPLSLTGDLGADTLMLKFYEGEVGVGWKVAWSDRMVYMYGATWLAAFGFFLLRRRSHVKAISPILFLLLLLPMGIDGFTHFISDFDGLTQGFRYNNAWLATLTNHVFADSFYSGDTFGSFNSLMRLISAITFGLAVVGLAFPYIDRNIHEELLIRQNALEIWQSSENELQKLREQLKANSSTSDHA